MKNAGFSHLMQFSQRGLSLVELMVAMAIGLVITGAVGSLFIDVLRSNREQFKAAEQIENGRYAMDVLYNDLRLAGFYGEFGEVPVSVTTLPDPCAIPAAATVTSTSTDALFSFHLQGVNTSTATGTITPSTGCNSWLTGSLQPGSDLLVVRRSDTNILLEPTTATPNPTALATDGQVYLQATMSTAALQIGEGDTVNKTMDATGAASALLTKDYSQAVDASGSRPTRAANIRRFRTHVYFVSRCSRGSGANGVCVAGTDDTIPTLKRLELSVSGASAPTWTMVPIAEGIEFFKVQFGIDDASAFAGRSLDAIPDRFTATPVVTEWPNVVATDVWVLARAVESSNEYLDQKSYNLGAFTFTPTGAAQRFRRNLFQSRIYLMNPGGRREF